MAVKVSFYSERPNVQSMADVERIMSRGSIYVVQDGGYFYAFSDAAHANDYDDDSAPLFFIDSGCDPEFCDMVAAKEARRIVANFLCTYGMVVFG